MQTESTTIEVTDGVAWIGIDDGKVNALSEALLGDIEARLGEAEAAGAIAVLKGRAGIFSAGFDLGTFAKGNEAGSSMVQAGARLVERLLTFPFPVVTACPGHAFPMGAFIMLAADVRFGVRGAFQIGMNEVAIGLTIPEFALAIARHRLSPQGFARASTAAMFDPDVALQHGYLDYVVEATELDKAVAEEAARLRSLDMPSYVGTKARINRAVIEAVRSGIAQDVAGLGASNEVTRSGPA